MSPYKNIEDKREACRRYYWRHKEKEKQRKHDFYLKNRDKILRRTKEYNKQHPKERLEKVKEYQKIHKKEVSARNKSRGSGIKKEKCKICESVEHLHYHHPDYDKPHDVVVLCASCHRRLHLGEIEIG